MVKVSGKIIFPAVPQNIPDGSLLTVKLQDVSRACGPSVVLGSCVKEITGYKHGDDVTYEINNPKLPTQAFGLALSAVLNMGWQASGDNWCRQGDYLNDTRHPFETELGKDTYQDKHVQVIHYK